MVQTISEAHLLPMIERVQIEVVVQTRGVAHIARILSAMRAEGYLAERVG
ncbi:MAG: hypothetical protein V4540_10295 [Pseudomonadota bacterium]